MLPPLVDRARPWTMLVDVHLAPFLEDGHV